MPELPEVEKIKKTLSDQILGRRIYEIKINFAKIALPRPDILAEGLEKQLIIAISRHGKFIIIELESGSFWTIHLGMSGQLIVDNFYPNYNHIHVSVSFMDQGSTLFYRDVRRFGKMRFWPTKDILVTDLLAHLGPDAWGLEDYAFAKLLAKHKACIKNVLLNQKILAGIGNIYANEALYRSKLAPIIRPIDLTLKKLMNLNYQLQKVLTEALNCGGSSIRNFIDAKGKTGTFQLAHLVYQREGLPCLTCGYLIKRVVLLGRSSYFCPYCQKEK